MPLHPLLAATLLEVLIVVAILAIAVTLLGLLAASMMAAAKKAAGGKKPLPSWVNPPATVPINKNVEFVFHLQLQAVDSQGRPTGFVEDAANYPVMFDLTMVRGRGHVVSVTNGGNALPQAQDASVGKPATNVLGGTDSDGIIRVVVQLEEDAQAELVAHESPDPKLPGWIAPALSFSAQ